MASWNLRISPFYIICEFFQQACCLLWSKWWKLLRNFYLGLHTKNYFGSFINSALIMCMCLLMGHWLFSAVLRNLQDGLTDSYFTHLFKLASWSQFGIVIIQGNVPQLYLHDWQFNQFWDLLYSFLHLNVMLSLSSYLWFSDYLFVCVFSAHWITTSPLDYLLTSVDKYIGLISYLVAPLLY